MNKYVALLRGIGPSNPNMRNENLRQVFEDLGFGKVRTVISSGNVLFETESRDVKGLEDMIEQALPEKLDFKSTTIIKSQEELQLLLEENPFKNLKDAPESKLNVTFLKNDPETRLEFPYHAENRGFMVLGIYDRAICSVVDLTRTKTPDLMRWLEKEFGREITTRTWRTVDRILKKMDET